MSLTDKQLADLRHDLTSLAHVTYAHLIDELLDHYAMLTEEKMAAGQSFYEASTDAWLAMGDGIGIQQIQSRYERMARRQIKDRHTEIRQSYLQWPTVMTTLLVGVLIAYLLLVVLPNPLVKLLTIVLVTSPVFVLLTAYVSYSRRRYSRQQLVWEFIRKQVSGPLIIVNLLNATDERNFSPVVHACLLVILTAGSLYSTISLAQLTRETFYYKPAY